MNIDELLKDISEIRNYQHTKDTSKELKLLMVKLIRENLVERNPSNNNYFQLTELGYKALDVGYDNLTKSLNNERNHDIRKLVQEEIIRRGTIEKFRYDKSAFWISVGAFIISLISLLLR